MVAARKNDSTTALPARRRPPATTPESRENQMIALAVDQVENQLRAGTASSQVLVHYLKLATSRERLEREKLTRETALLQARQEALASQERVEELYAGAIRAMKAYSGADEETQDDY